MPRAIPIRSQIKNAQTAEDFNMNQGLRHQGRVRRCHAAQLTKNRMWRVSSCITGSNVSMSSGGKYPERLATSNSPNAKKLSTHSLYPVTRHPHAGSRGTA